MSKDIVWHDGAVSKQDRSGRLNQKSVLLWLTGLSGSGKSSISVELEKALFDRGNTCYRLDGDNIRHGLNANIGFSPEDRTENIRRIGEVSKLFVDAGIITMAAFVSPYQSDREAVRKLMEPDEFVEIFVDCPIEVCEQRDVKGLYAKARAGEISDFTGISAPYEAPTTPEITIHSAEQSIHDSVAEIITYLKSKGYIV